MKMSSRLSNNSFFYQATASINTKILSISLEFSKQWALMTQKPGHRPLSLPNLLIPRLNIESGSDSPSLRLRNIPFFQKYWLRSLHDLLDLQTRPFCSSESFTMKTGESERTAIELECGLKDRSVKSLSQPSTERIQTCPTVTRRIHSLTPSRTVSLSF